MTSFQKEENIKSVQDLPYYFHSGVHHAAIYHHGGADGAGEAHGGVWLNHHVPG